MLLPLTLLCLTVAPGPILDARGAAAATSAPPSVLHEDDEAGPTRGQVTRALERLEQAFSSKEDRPQERVGALQEAAMVPDPRVIREVVRALGDPHRDVVSAAVAALGELRHEDALEALLKYGKKHKKALARDDERQVALLKAVGRHGSKDTLDFLADDLFKSRVRPVDTARILSIGYVRDPEAVDRLMKLMKTADHRRVQSHMGDFRLALVVLTGKDFDLDPLRWQKWWRDARKGFEVSDELAPMEKELWQRWRRHWGLERTYERNTRRDDRGQDPDGDKS